MLSTSRKLQPPSICVRMMPRLAGAVGEKMSDCEHLVEFFDSDERLVSQAADFLLEGFENGATCIAVFTDEHRQQIDAVLNAQGAHTDNLAADYRYVFVDAHAALDSLMLHDKLDIAEFHRTFGGLLQLAASGGKSVRIVGEVVSLLVAKGKFATVIELEEAWNELSRMYAFGLYCVYLTNAVAPSFDAAYRNHICSIHSRELSAAS
jgi:MEDS: MEthanogen/methylotroph, DcmR Sensory domain